MKESHPLFLWPPWSYPQGAVLMLIGGGGKGLFWDARNNGLFTHPVSEEGHETKQGDAGLCLSTLAGSSAQDVVWSNGRSHVGKTTQMECFQAKFGSSQPCTFKPTYWHWVVVKETATFTAGHQTRSPGRFSSVQQLGHVWLFGTPWTAARQSAPSITNSWSFIKLMSIKSVMPSNHLILCRPLLLLPSIFPIIRVFSSDSVLCIRWPKYWSFNFSISPSYEYSGLISFRIDWFDLLAVQGILKNLVQHHSLKLSILWSSAFFMVQLSHPYMTTGKTIALTRWTIVARVTCLHFNVLPRFVMAFLPKSKFLLISWLQSPSTVIFESEKINFVTISIVSPSICHEVMAWFRWHNLEY